MATGHKKNFGMWISASGVAITIFRNCHTSTLNTTVVHTFSTILHQINIPVYINAPLTSEFDHPKLGNFLTYLNKAFKTYSKVQIDISAHHLSPHLACSFGEIWYLIRKMFFCFFLMWCAKIVGVILCECNLYVKIYDKCQ